MITELLTIIPQIIQNINYLFSENPKFPNPFCPQNQKPLIFIAHLMRTDTSSKNFPKWAWYELHISSHSAFSKLTKGNTIVPFSSCQASKKRAQPFRRAGRESSIACPPELQRRRENLISTSQLCNMKKLVVI